MTKIKSKASFMLLFLLLLGSVSALADNTGACYIRVQYGPVLPDVDHMDDMMQDYCYSNLTRKACDDQARRGNFRGLVLYTAVIAWLRGEDCNSNW